MKKFLLASLLVLLIPLNAFATTKNVLISRASGTISSGLDTYTTISGDANNTSVTEGNESINVRSNGGVFDHLAIHVNANTFTVNAAVNFFKNGSIGSQSAVVTAGNTGTFVDATNTDTLSTGDNASYEIKVGADVGKSATFNWISSTLAPTTNFTLYNAGSGQDTSSAQVEQALMSNQTATSANIARVQNKFEVGGTLQKAMVTVTSNTVNANNTHRINKNGTNTAIVATVTALGTGDFEDSSNTDSISATDLITWETENISGSNAVSVMKIEFLSSDSAINQLVGSSVSIADGATKYLSLEGRGTQAGTEIDAAVPVYFTYSATKLEIQVTTNATSGTSTFDLRVGSASSALTVAITAAATGYIMDSTHTVTGSSGDALNYRIVNGGGGALGGNNITYGMLMAETTASSSSVKTWDGLAIGSVKTINGLATASVKTINGLA